MSECSNSVIIPKTKRAYSNSPYQSKSLVFSTPSPHKDKDIDTLVRSLNQCFPGMLEEDPHERQLLSHIEARQELSIDRIFNGAIRTVAPPTRPSNPFNFGD